MKRFQSRRGNGRFQRTTLANTFGLRALVCRGCNGFNTIGLGDPWPEKCQQCGKPWTDEPAPPACAECGHGESDHLNHGVCVLVACKCTSYLAHVAAQPSSPAPTGDAP